MTHLNPLPFQFEVEDIFNQIQNLRSLVNSESDLAETLDVIAAKLEPFFGNVEFIPPVPAEELFRKAMWGMKL